MHFQLTDEQRMIQDLAREFADREIVPVAAQADRDQVFPAAHSPQGAGVGPAEPGSA